MAIAHGHRVMDDRADDARRRRLHGGLKDRGEALQSSVFRVQATDGEPARMRRAMRRHFSEQDDRLVVARLRPGCADRVVVEGRDVQGVSFGDSPPDAFVV